MRGIGLKMVPSQSRSRHSVHPMPAEYRVEHSLDASAVVCRSHFCHAKVGLRGAPRQIGRPVGWRKHTSAAVCLACDGLGCLGGVGLVYILYTSLLCPHWEAGVHAVCLACGRYVCLAWDVVVPTSGVGGGTEISGRWWCDSDLPKWVV